MAMRLKEREVGKRAKVRLVRSDHIDDDDDSERIIASRMVVSSRCQDIGGRSQ